MSIKNKPEKSYRKGISILDLVDIFPDEKSARQWLESCRWPEQRYCPHCGSLTTNHLKTEKPMPYHCRDCRKFFSVRTKTIMAESKISLRKWVYAIYLWATSLKGVSSMKLHRDLKITQKSAWFMAHRLREAFSENGGTFIGPVEADETYIGGLEKNKHSNKKLRNGRGSVGKIAIVGMKDRASNAINAKVIEKTDASTLQGLVTSHTTDSTTIYTDENRAYVGLKNHHTVRHSTGEYVVGDVHTNGIESFWATLKRAHKGTFHHMSAKHMQRYVNEFVGRYNIRNKDTIDQMNQIVVNMVGRRLTYDQLIKE